MMEMRSSGRKHKKVNRWALAVVADAARALSEHRKQGKYLPTGFPLTKDGGAYWLPDSAERCVCCDQVKNPEKQRKTEQQRQQRHRLHCGTFSHCYSLLVACLTEGFTRNPPLEPFWKQHLETHIPDADTRDGLVAAINLGALS